MNSCWRVVLWCNSSHKPSAPWGNVSKSPQTDCTIFTEKRCLPLCWSALCLASSCTLVIMTPCNFTPFQAKNIFPFPPVCTMVPRRSYPTAAKLHLAPYPSSQIILMCSSVGNYTHQAEAISFAGTLQQSGKAREEPIPEFQIQRELKCNGLMLSGLEIWG